MPKETSERKPKALTPIPRKAEYLRPPRPEEEEEFKVPPIAQTEPYEPYEFRRTALTPTLMEKVIRKLTKQK